MGDLLHTYKGIAPKVADGVFIAPGARVVGRVTLHSDVSIWFNCVVRGDTDTVTIGENTNIQDGTIVHTEGGHPVEIGRNVTVGHGCILHACWVGDDSLIGMGSTVLTGAKLGARCVVGAGSLITEGKEFPDGSVIMGRPAKVIRQVEERDLELIRRGADHYRQYASEYAAEERSV